MQLADPLVASWKAKLSLAFHGATRLRHASDGPLVVQKPLYPEGPSVCHAIVVHPPGGIAGGDELELDATVEPGSHGLLTTPGAAKWYRSAGPCARQHLRFDVAGTLEWLPRETIVFDGALCALQAHIHLNGEARFIGWEVLCLGRFARGRMNVGTSVSREGRIVFAEKADIEGGGRLMRSPVGLGGRTVCGTFIATSDAAATAREAATGVAVTAFDGLIVGRYLGDSSEEALQAFTRLWRALRPSVAGREAVAPRIWST
jgi:urease accessory protein